MRTSNLAGEHYKGYTIRHNLAGFWWIEDASGQLVARDCGSEEKARAWIDAEVDLSPLDPAG